ncbi:aldo/keto reductase [Nonomuraea gerenzanensis]|uniref:L-fuco-beta-pyranose dehydrogenase n=1 Tax=Nonomuraea gerenzanensis TaxID=93944 RepID=A0A1M4EP06_9ACTN|nr:aldo/keto reductase [Nonomuraea gerenzanensis]UBU12065.1 aldo/keto reductase [Nonomuraea gerenzanensis]SBP00581.1 L-fuco-beta-pyranose dehydrogenase [Nonomuraea gerenzanensis]
MAIDLPRHGFGGAPIGNLYDEVAEEQARATVDAAWESGVRLYDTAPHYGLGLSERRLGAALAGRSGYLLSTKVGRLLRPKASGDGRDDDVFDVAGDLERVWDFSADGVRTSLDDSLVRLGLPAVDLALIHDPDDHVDQAIAEAYPALADLRAEGRVRAVGVGMNQWEAPLRFVQETDIDVVMLAGRYTLLDQSGLPLLDECARRGVQVLAAGVFNSGILATHEPAGTYDYAPAPPELLDRATRIARVCERHDVTLPHAAMAFPLRHPAIATIVLGARTPEEVRRNAELWSRPVPEELWSDLEGEGLLAAAT